MIVNAWRVRATAEEFELPPDGVPFDVRLLTEGRAEWLREVEVEMPFLVSPLFEYDVVLNRFFQSPGMRMHAVSTQFGYARDLAAFRTFLWVSRRRKGWRDAAEEDHLAYLVWRRRDDDGPRVVGATWNREVAGADAFYRWAVRAGHVPTSPIPQVSQRLRVGAQYALLPPWTVGARDGTCGMPMVGRDRSVGAWRYEYGAYRTDPHLPGGRDPGDVAGVRGVE
ncbi:site-specific integrase [Streptomyces sp. NPDC056244]|uniref:site-specific integrase n=1 Tax=Streptomyces sp. NPDC056244 TaxID=3345762 RepID=UPI0035E29E88